MSIYWFQHRKYIFYGCSILTHTKVTLSHTKVTLPHTKIFFRLKWLKKFLCAVRWLLCAVRWLLCAVKWILYALMCKKYASMYYYLCVKMINQNLIDCKIKWFKKSTIKVCDEIEFLVIQINFMILEIPILEVPFTLSEIQDYLT